MSLVGKNMEEQIWNFCLSKGLNDCGAASLMGNLFCESGLNPKNLENTGNKKLGMTDDEYVAAVDSGVYTKEQFINDKFGFGEAQWTYVTRKKALYEFAKSKNISIGDLEMQLEFLYKELSESYPSVLATLKTAKSILEASNAVLLKYERPADQSVTVQNKRASYGQNYYNKYAINGNKGDGKMTYTKGKKVKLSNNFYSTEFDCHGVGCCSTTEIDPKLIEYVQKIRDHFKAPITINSGYRCAKHNKKIGGASASRHTQDGSAADIDVKGHAPLEVAQYCESIGILGIGLYETDKDGYFVHIDTRTTKSFWYGQAQAKRTTFGGTATVESKPKVDAKIDTVKEVQQWLNRDYKFNLSEDGIYGAKTKAALIKVLQKAIGVEGDGIYGANTRSAIKVLRLGSTGEAVKALQGLLVCNGYTSVNVDGEYGNITTNAVRSYQSATKQGADGKAGKNTFDALCK